MTERLLAPSLTLTATKADAHGGLAVRSVDVYLDDGGQSYVVSGGADASARTWVLSDIASGPESITVLNDEIYDIDASNDLSRGPIIVTGEGGWNGGPDGDTLRVLSPSSSSPPNLDELAGYVTGGYNYCVAISPARDGKVLVAASGYYGSVNIRQLDDATCTSASATCPLVDVSNSIIEGDRRVDAISFVPGSPLRLARSLGGTVDIYLEDATTATGQFGYVASLDHSGKWENFMDVSPDGSMLVSGNDGGGGSIKLWDISDTSSSQPSYEILGEDSPPGGTVFSVAFSGDGSYVAAGGSGWMSVYDSSDVAAGPLVTEPNAHGGRIYSLAFDVNDPRTLVSASADGSIKVWSFISDPSTTSSTAASTTTTFGTTASTTSGTTSSTTSSNTVTSCLGLDDSKGSNFCQRKASAWCPPNGSTVQCDKTCCCYANPNASGC